MTRPWVCLLYHDVVPRRPRRDGGAEWFAVSVRAFEQQLDIMRDAGLDGCSMEEALTCGGAEHPVAISFDDGCAGQYRYAVPALLDREMTATFFITTEWVGRPGYVTWDQLREMKSAGMSIQSHTCTHPILSELQAGELNAELRRSKRELDSRLAQDTLSVALPHGDWPRRSLRRLLADAGYRTVATSHWGQNPGDARDGPGPSRVYRCTVKDEPTAAHFRRIVRGDPRLALRRRTREKMLQGVKSLIGMSSYLSLRQRVLDACATWR